MERTMRLPEPLANIRSTVAGDLGWILRLAAPITLRAGRFVYEIWGRSQIRGKVASRVQFIGFVTVEGTQQVHVSAHTRLGRRTFLKTDGSGRIEIGEHVTINDGATIVAYDRISIGDHVMIGEYVTIRDSNHGTRRDELVRCQPQRRRAGDDWTRCLDWSWGVRPEGRLHRRRRGGWGEQRGNARRGALYHCRRRAGPTDRRAATVTVADATPKVELFGISVCNLTYEGLCDGIDRHVATREPGFIVTPNVDHVCRYHRDPSFREAYDHASFVLADGMPLLWSARLLGRPLLEKLSGSDLLPRLSGFAAERGYSVYYLGAAEGVAEAAAERLKMRYPSLRVAGTYSPPFGFERDPQVNASIVARLREARPDICFVALGSPKQETWLYGNYAAAEIPAMIGVGAAFDFVAGRVRRAPRWMQKTGMEWIWRLIQEPRRLAKRYLIEDSYFFVLLAREIRRRVWARAL